MITPYLDEDFAARVDSSVLRAVLETVSSAVVIRDVAGRFVAFNEAALTVLGATADQLLGKAPHDPRWRAVLNDGTPVTAEQSPTTVAIRTGKPSRSQTMRLHLPDGTLRWLEVSASPIRDVTGAVIAGVVSYHDITESRRASDLIAMHEARMAAMLEESDQGTYEWDFVADHAARSLHVYEMVGYRPGEIGVKGTDWLKLVHADDRESVGAMWAEVRAGGVDRYEHEYRVLHRDGRVLWLRSHARVIRRDTTGRAQRVTGTLQDVTGRREVEEELKRERARSAQLEARLANARSPG